MRVTVEIDDDQVIRVLENRLENGDADSIETQTLHAEVSAILTSVYDRFSVGCSH